MESRNLSPQPVASSGADPEWQQGEPSQFTGPQAVEEKSGDMYDTQDERGIYKDLPLRACDGWVVTYKNVDKLALEFQRSHFFHAWTAAGLGMLAVISAILEMVWPEPWIVFVEFGLVLFAGAAAWHGSYGKTKEKWLAYRHQAELYRQLKFKLLIHPKVWTDADWGKRELDRIAEIHPTESLEEEIEGPPPHGYLEVEEQALDWPTTRHLVEYYVAKRLNPQMEYLANRAQRNEYKDFFLRWANFLFFISVVAAGAHAVFYILKSWGILSAHNRVLLSGEAALLIAAACLPVIVAGTRTLRAAFEFSRNKSRFKSAYAALKKVEMALLHDALAGFPAGDAKEVADQSLKVLRQMWWAEYILCNEHHEWLRLMVETEWYG